MSDHQKIILSRTQLTPAKEITTNLNFSKKGWLVNETKSKKAKVMSKRNELPQGLKVAHHEELLRDSPLSL